MTILSYFCLSSPCQQQLSRKVLPREKSLQLDIFLFVTAFYYRPPPKVMGNGWIRMNKPIDSTGVSSSFTALQCLSMHRLPPHQPSLVLAAHLDCTCVFCVSQVGWQRIGDWGGVRPDFCGCRWQWHADGCRGEMPMVFLIYSYKPDTSEFWAAGTDIETDYSYFSRITWDFTKYPLVLFVYWLGNVFKLNKIKIEEFHNYGS